MSDTKLSMLIVAFFGLLHFVWAASVLAVCTYLVFWRGFSGWWYLLAIVLAGASSTSSEMKEST